MASLTLSTLAAVPSIGQAGFLFEGLALGFDLFVLPELLREDPPEGLRLRDIQVTSVEEGSPARRAFGHRIKTAGTLIWQSEIKERSYRQSGKGGGGKGPTQFSYYTSWAMEFARTRGEPIFAVETISFNGKPHYEDGGDIDITSTKISAEVVHSFHSRPGGTFLVLRSPSVADGGVDLTQFKRGRVIDVTGFVDGTHPLLGALTVSGNQTADATVNVYDTGELLVSSTTAGQLGVGASFTIDNDSTSTTYYVTRPTRFLGSGDVLAISIKPPIAENVSNGDALLNLVTNASKNTSTTESTLYVASARREAVRGGSKLFIWARQRKVHSIEEVAYAERFAANEFNAPEGSTDAELIRFGDKLEGDTVRLRQDSGTHARSVKNYRFHLGEGDQQPDPLILATEEDAVGGAGNVPGFRNRVVVVAEDHNVTFGAGVLPQVQATLVVGLDPSIGGAVRKYCTEDVGLSDAEVDVSALTQDFEGMIVAGPQRGSAALAPLMIAGYVVPVDREGVVTFLDKRNLEVVVVDSNDLGASAGEEEPDIPFRHFPADHLSSVDRLSVSFLDKDLEFRRASVPSQGPGRVSASTEIGLSLAMGRDDATQLADALHDVAEFGRDRVRFTLPPSYMSTSISGRAPIRTGVVANLGTHFSRPSPWLVLVETVELGANGLMLCEGLVFDEGMLTQTKTAQAPIVT